MLSMSNIFFFAVSYNPSFSKKNSVYMCVYFFFEGICVYIYIINIFKIKQYEFIHLFFYILNITLLYKFILFI